MKPKRTWVLLADAAQAKIVEYIGPGRGLQPVEGAVFSHIHASTHNLTSSRPGRAFDGMGQGRHSMESGTDAHAYEKYKFARELVQFLEVKAQQDDYDRLILVLPPRMLGDFRGLLKQGTQLRVYKELAKDLVSVPLNELPSHLQEVIAF